MKSLIITTLKKLKKSTASVKSRSLKNSFRAVDNDLNFEIYFDGFKELSGYVDHLDVLYEEIATHFDEQIIEPKRDASEFLIELYQLKSLIKTDIKWYFPNGNYDQWFTTIKFEKTNQEYQQDQRVKEIILKFLRTKHLFLMRLRNLVNYQIKMIEGCLSLKMEHLLTPKEVRALSKGQQLLFPSGEEVGLKWARSQRDLLEIIVPMLKTGAFTFLDGKVPNQNQVFDMFSRLFHIKLTNPQSTLYAARGRKKDATPYLTELQRAFMNEESFE